MVLVLRVVSLACAGICCLLARDCVSSAYGQGPAVDVVLARAVVAESGLSHAADQAAVLHVLGKRARKLGVSVDDMARRYVSGFRVEPTERMRWVMALEPTCDQPPHWPATLRWGRHRAACLETFERVRQYLAGELQDPCRSAQHWGSRHLASDLARAHRAGWVLARCSSATRNFFWRAP